MLPTIGIALCLAASGPTPAAGPAPTTLTLWPGYTINLPAGYCVTVSMGPDFRTLYFRDPAAPKSPILVGLYAGHNPREPECDKPKVREWTAEGLAFKSVRGPDACAEFAVHDPKKWERGVLHLWFGPGAKDHPQLAEGVIASIHPAQLPVEPTDPPACK